MKHLDKPKEILELGIATIAIFSALFFLTGFFYNYFYLSYFDIDVSKYFTIPDYLESNVSIIFACVLITLWGLIPSYTGIFLAKLDSIKEDREFDEKYSDPCERCEAARKSLEDAKKRLNKATKASNTINLIVLLYFSVLMILYIWHGGWNVISGTIFPLFFILYLGYKLHTSLGKEKELKAQTLHAIAAYPFILYMLTSTSIINTLNSYSTKNDNKIFLTDKSLEIPTTNLFYISSNSKYLFFLDKKKKPIIIPRDQISYYREESEIRNPFKWFIIKEFKNDNKNKK